MSVSTPWICCCCRDSLFCKRVSLIFNIVLVDWLNHLDHPTQGAEQLTATMSQIFSSLCIQLSQPTDFRICMLAMQCMHLLLQKRVSQNFFPHPNKRKASDLFLPKPRNLSQWNIDNTLTVIAVVSSRSAYESQVKHAGMIYLGLCRLFGTLLAVHREKLGGRYHLIVPALQGLLRSLFIPYATAPAPNGPRRPTTDHASVGEPHAAAYARLLTMLCSPTVSAVTRSRNHRNTRQSLNDETKKACSIAGQHLPYLIMEYCACQLKGRLPPEVKAALNPGLWAVLDVVQQEAMRTMNAAMDSSCRSIFKALYEEYRRLGGGTRR